MLRWFTRHLFPPRPRVQAATAQLERYAVARAVLSQFGAFLVRASDRELFHVNPRYMAEKLGSVPQLPWWANWQRWTQYLVAFVPGYLVMASTASTWHQTGDTASFQSVILFTVTARQSGDFRPLWSSYFVVFRRQSLITEVEGHYQKLSLQERPALKLMVAALPLLEHYPNTEVTPRHTVGLSESSIMVPSLPNLLIQRAIDYSRRAPFLP